MFLHEKTGDLIYLREAITNPQTIHDFKVAELRGKIPRNLRVWRSFTNDAFNHQLEISKDSVLNLESLNYTFYTETGEIFHHLSPWQINTHKKEELNRLYKTMSMFYNNQLMTKRVVKIKVNKEYQKRFGINESEIYLLTNNLPVSYVNSPYCYMDKIIRVTPSVYIYYLLEQGDISYALDEATRLNVDIMNILKLYELSSRSKAYFSLEYLEYYLETQKSSREAKKIRKGIEASDQILKLMLK